MIAVSMDTSETHSNLGVITIWIPRLSEGAAKISQSEPFAIQDD